MSAGASGPPSLGFLGEAGRTELASALVASAPDALYVIDAQGAIGFVNPAALQVLGYTDEAQLLGRPSHATIHNRHADGSAYPESECPLLRPRVTGETVRVERDWFVRRDGSMVPVAYASAPIETPDGRGAIVSFRDTREQLRAERALRAQAAQEAHLAEVQASRARLVEAAERERRQVARDLHDGAQQQLVQVMLELQLAEREWASEEAHEHLRRALRAAREAITELRELSQGIHPRVLVDRGLSAAVAALADRAPFPVTLEVAPARYPEAIEAAAYFFVAEALTNAAKHAEASEARVRARERAGILEVEVSDDGIGGIPARAAGGGLAGLVDRLGAVGGMLEVESPPGAGSVLRARLPLSGAGS